MQDIGAAKPNARGACADIGLKSGFNDFLDWFFMLILAKGIQVVFIEHQNRYPSQGNIIYFGIKKAIELWLADAKTRKAKGNSMINKKNPTLIERPLSPELSELIDNIKAINAQIDSLDYKIERLGNETKTENEGLEKEILSKFNSLEKRLLVVKICPSKIHGMGLFALRAFKEEDIIFRSIGEIRNSRTRRTIELTINEHFEPTGIVEGPININALAKVNHACDPNSYVQHDSKSGFLILKALTNISAYEEITIDYCATETESIHPFVCNCGKSNCIKYVDCKKHNLKRL